MSLVSVILHGGSRLPPCVSHLIIWFFHFVVSKYISLHRIVVLLPPSPTSNLHVFDFSTCKISFFSHVLGFNYVVYVIYILEIAIR